MIHSWESSLQTGDLIADELERDGFAGEEREGGGGQRVGEDVALEEGGCSAGNALMSSTVPVALSLPTSNLHHSCGGSEEETNCLANPALARQ